MSIQMYMVGGVLFAIYIYFTIWNIFRNNKAQERRSTDKSSNRVSSEEDGMGQNSADSKMPTKN